jgi:hypothetical protein
MFTFQRIIHFGGKVPDVTFGGVKDMHAVRDCIVVG